MELERASGILLHPTSLPGPYGVGDLGAEAYRFVDILAEMGQTIWQILPLGHISYGNSPYMCLSAFGGNPYLIILGKLVEEGLLDPGDVTDPPPFPADRADYGGAIRYRMPLFKKSFESFGGMSDTKFPDAFYAFCEENAFWLEDHALTDDIRQRLREWNELYERLPKSLQ